MTTKLDKVLYTAQSHTTGGRDGAARSSDAALDVRLSPPGSGKPGTNPEQLFAAGYSACFHSALQAVARNQKVELGDSAVGARVGIGKQGEGFQQLVDYQLVAHWCSPWRFQFR